MSAEEILNKFCDSLPAWSENRKQKVLSAMEAYRNQDDRIQKAIEWCEEQMQHWQGISIKYNAYLYCINFLKSLNPLP